MTKIVQSFQSVSSFALSQAIYMGCSEIYLLGFDFYNPDKKAEQYNERMGISRDSISLKDKESLRYHIHWLEVHAKPNLQMRLQVKSNQRKPLE